MNTNTALASSRRTCKLDFWPPVAPNAPINPVPDLIEAPLEHDPEVAPVTDVALVEVALEALQVLAFAVTYGIWYYQH